MKKLNRKGFTLIELLAVIVIMAIIVVVTVPTIINTISDARVNSIWNLAVATANSYDTSAANDLIATTKVLEGVEANEGWQCIGTLLVKDASGNVTKSLAEMLDLSKNDVNLGGDYDATTDTGITSTINQNTCSAIKLKSNGSAEVLIVAKDGGKFAKLRL